MWIFPGINKDSNFLFLTCCLLWQTTFQPPGPQDRWCKEKGVSQVGKGVLWSEASSSHIDLLSSLQPTSTEHLLYAKLWARPMPIEIIQQGKKAGAGYMSYSSELPRSRLQLHTSTNDRSHSVGTTFPASVPSNIWHVASRTEDVY